MPKPPERRFTRLDPRAAAEAAFRSPKTPPPLPADKPPAAAAPGTKEPVTLRIDRDILEFFQADGPGWQDRIVAALRKVAGK